MDLERFLLLYVMGMLSGVIGLKTRECRTIATVIVNAYANVF